MSKPKDNKPTAKEIADKVLRRRREGQYSALLEWRDKKITGIECIEEIERLQGIITLDPEDFKAPKPKLFGRK
jgi:hypothetical protein